MKEFERIVWIMVVMQKITDEQKYTWALLACAEGGVGAAELRRLQLWLDNNGLAIGDFWERFDECVRLAGWKESKVEAVRELRQEWTVAKFAEYLREHQIKVTHITDADYPVLLRFIPDFAPVLFYQGDLAVLSRAALAVVGTRQVTAYGETVIKELLTAPLDGVTIVSGMMHGVDALAHRQALARGWPTAAFLGYGLQLCWPRSVTALKGQIVANGGVIVSEFAPWCEPLPWRFPARNRLVAGASAATLVVEAAAKSGSLITAQLALDYGREVMAVPGSIFSPLSVGCLELIKKGALPVVSAAEIAAGLRATSLSMVGESYWQTLGVASSGGSCLAPAASKPTTVKTFVDAWQEKVYRQLSGRPLESEELCRACGGEAEVLAACGLLELAGEIARGEDGKWRVTSK